MEEPPKKIFPFLLNALYKKRYPKVLQWVDVYQLIFRIKHLNSRNESWKKDEDAMSQMYIDWAQIKDKLDDKKKMRGYKHTFDRAFKCPYHKDKVRELSFIEEDWRYFQLLKKPEELLKTKRRCIKLEKAKQQKKKKDVTEKKAAEIESVEPNVQKASSSASSSSGQNGEDPVPKSLPPFPQTFVKGKSTLSTLSPEQLEAFVNIGDQAEHLNHHGPYTEYTQPLNNDCRDEMPLYLNTLSGPTPDLNLKILLCNPGNNLNTAEFDNEHFSNQAYTPSPAQSFFETVAEIGLEQSLQQIPAFGLIQSDGETNLNDAFANFSMIGFPAIQSGF